MNEIRTTSTRPYLLRALHEWCTDNGLTPYLVVQADESVQVPLAFVQDGQIVLNTSYDATSGLQMGNEFVHFKARFGGKPHEIIVPVGRVLAIYARETGQGMSFPPEEPQAMDEVVPPASRPAVSAKVQLVSSQENPPSEQDHAPQDDDLPPPPTKRPALKLVK
ncbi:MAG: ClpXP protease specificity-enhancing factor [Comamonas sp.]|jgi:stringent starvation protein B|nr:ClpXP protease specificity-enhancing factor [Comamonas sp.]